MVCLFVSFCALLCPLSIRIPLRIPLPYDELVDEVQRTVAYLVISVALMVELLQLYRIVASDWTLVWLICSDIQHSSSQLQYLAKLKKNALKLLSKLRRLRGRRYWKKSIQQYSVIETCTAISPSIWKRAKFLSLTDFVTSWYIKSKPVEDEFKQFIIDQVKAKFSSEDSVETCRDRVKLHYNNLREDLWWASNTDDEHLILHWHIATTICEEKFCRTQSTVQPKEEIKKWFRLSRTLSNYSAYLLVSSHDFLPLHADIGKMVYIEVHSGLVLFLSTSGIQDLKNYGSQEHPETTLEHGTKLARELLRIEIAERWRILSDYWAALLIYYASVTCGYC
ncbi:hypothetical protein SUGI_0507650 [Cryptomeria japonica]|nr:hypothetical protein SUGI_0507650 [Cryptomeria japonica]